MRVSRTRREQRTSDWVDAEITSLLASAEVRRPTPTRDGRDVRGTRFVGAFASRLRLWAVTGGRVARGVTGAPRSALGHAYWFSRERGLEIILWTVGIALLFVLEVALFRRYG
jgi:hypothetical protein